MIPCANLRILAKKLQQMVEGVNLVGTMGTSRCTSKPAKMLCAWQSEVNHDSKLSKDAKSNVEGSSVVASSLKEKKSPSPALSTVIHMSMAEAQNTLQVRAREGGSKRSETQLEVCR